MVGLISESIVPEVTAADDGERTNICKGSKAVVGFRAESKQLPRSSNRLTSLSAKPAAKRDLPKVSYGWNAAAQIRSNRTEARAIP